MDASGLRYQLTPCGTCIEGGWDEVMALVAKRHQRACQLAPHVFTTIRVEDDRGEHDKMERNVRSVAARVPGAFAPITMPRADATEVFGVAGWETVSRAVPGKVTDGETPHAPPPMNQGS
ncbi:MAG: thiamine-binding protein [Planctomycetota bacterium]